MALDPDSLKTKLSCVAGGMGGQTKILGNSEMPIGMAGACGLCLFVVLEHPSSDQTTPPLIPINLLKKLDAVIRPKHEIMTLADAGVTTKLVSIERKQHQTTSLMNFSAEGWAMPEEVIEACFRQFGGNPFISRTDGPD